MKLQHNIAAMQTIREYSKNSKGLSGNLERLSSGSAINKAADNAAGLAISEKMRRQLKGLDQGINNCNDGISFNQVADGAMREVSSILNRMETLSVESLNGTYDDLDRQAIQEEIKKLNMEMERIFSSTNFNNVNVFNDNVGGADAFLGNAGAVVDRTSLATLLGNSNIYDGARLGASMDVIDATNWVSSAPNTNAENRPLKNNSSYPSAWMDFSGFGTKYTADDLSGLGFSTTCDHGCGRYYSIQFTTSTCDTTSGGVNYTYSGVGSQNPLLKINISDCTSGADIVDHVVKASKANSDFVKHYQQYAYNTADPDKLYVIDDSAKTLHSTITQTLSTFEPHARDASGNVIQTTPMDEPEEQPKGIWIQSGDTEGDGFYLQKPYLNVLQLGTDKIDLTTQESAGKALDIVKNAIKIVGLKRGMVGAQQNRCEHAVEVTKDTVTNVTASESQIRDADMAKEMTEFSKTNVLLQASQSMLAQANAEPEGILQLLQ